MLQSLWAVQLTRKVLDKQLQNKHVEQSEPVQPELHEQVYGAAQCPCPLQLFKFVQSATHY